MLQYICDWCGKPRSHGDRWILGLAADRVGNTVRRRELEILKSWSPFWANHPLAVHFCSAEHRDNYTRALFRPQQRSARAKSSRPLSAGISVSGNLSIASHSASATKKRISGSKPSVSSLGPAEGHAEPPKPWKRRRFTKSDKVRAHGLGVRL